MDTISGFKIQHWKKSDLCFNISTIQLSNFSKSWIKQDHVSVVSELFILMLLKEISIFLIISAVVHSEADE